MERAALILTPVYSKLIEEDFFPYWEKFRDRKYGGILNCISNDGKKLLSDHKFTWSQGRWLWILGKLHELCEKQLLRGIDRHLLEEWMEETYGFIIKYSLAENGTCNYLLKRDGERIKDENTGRFDTSIYADCFALLGMSGYTRVMGKEANLPDTVALYESIVQRVESGNFLTEPYPVPEGYCAHGIPMIMINTIQEYIRMKQYFSLPCEREIQYGMEKINQIWNCFYDGKYIREFAGKGKVRENSMLEHHINPGHTLEDLWFMTEFMGQFGGLEKYLSRICAVARDTFSLGWDEKYGGLFRFVDINGGKPEGESEHLSYEKLVEETWDMKLWWPHSEILYLFPCLYKLTGDKEMKLLYEQSADYVFSVFPNKEIGEWNQICRRAGIPEERIVALPVKDPFHIIRCFIKIIELEEKEHYGIL